MKLSTGDDRQMSRRLGKAFKTLEIDSRVNASLLDQGFVQPESSPSGHDLERLRASVKGIISEETHADLVHASCCESRDRDVVVALCPIRSARRKKSRRK